MKMAKWVRRRKNVLVSEIAVRIGVSKESYLKWERHGIELEDYQLEKLSKLLGKEPEELNRNVQTLLAKARADSGLTAVEVSIIGGCSVSTLYAVENFQVSHSGKMDLRAICKRFGILPSQAFTLVPHNGRKRTGLVKKRQIIDATDLDCSLCGKKLKVHRRCKFCTAFLHPKNKKYECQTCREQHAIDNGKGLCAFCAERADILNERLNKIREEWYVQRYGPRMVEESYGNPS